MAITPASIRNNNPGAMYPGKSAKKFGSRSFEVLKSKDGVHKIATFPTPVHGAAAQFDLLHNSYCGMPLEKAITKWCGAYYVSTYLKVLETSGGIKRTDVLTKEHMKDPKIAIPLARAMALQEAGRDFPMDDDDWEAAHSMAFSAGVAPAFSPDNDVPTPKQETRVADTVNAVKTVAAVATAGAGTATVATQKTEAPPAPKPTTKEQVAKAKEQAKEIRETVEVAKDYATWGKGIAVAAYDQWMVVVPLTMIAGVAIFWRQIRERF
mgnify:CR=1 FL=1